MLAAALGTVADSLSDLMPQAFAVAEYAREAVKTGALTADPPDGDDLNRRTLTVADLRARTSRAAELADATGRLVNMITDLAERCEDPAERSAWWQVWDRAVAEAEGTRLASRRAWDAYIAARDKESNQVCPSTDTGADSPDAARPSDEEERPPSGD